MDKIKIKSVIRKRYAESVKTGGCCCSPAVPEVVSSCYGSPQVDDSSPADEVIAIADLGLSCGFPVSEARIKPGDKVLDLGSGAGVDVFRAAQIIGDTGHATGIDMTPEMIAQARQNAQTGGYQNTDFKLGEIENLPVSDESQDVVISNCVINLVSNKELAFKEIYRVLKPGGHFSISDIVTTGEIPDSFQKDKDAWVACLAGAVEKRTYLEMLINAGFIDVKVVLTKEYGPELFDALSFESITVIGYKDK